MMRGTKWSVVAAALILPLAACDSTGSRIETAMTELEQKEPVFALLRQHEPSAYGEIRGLVERIVGEGSQPDQAQLIRRGRELFTGAIERRVASAPDDVVQQMTTFIADQTQALEKNPALCRDHLAGTSGDIRPSIPADLQQRERALYETLLKAPGRAEQPVATPQQLQTIFGGMLEDAEKALGLSEAAVTSGLNGVGSPLDVCRTNGYMMRRISQLPANEAAPIFRLITRLAGQARQAQAPVAAPKQ